MQKFWKFWFCFFINVIYSHKHSQDLYGYTNLTDALGDIEESVSRDSYPNPKLLVKYEEIAYGILTADIRLVRRCWDDHPTTHLGGWMIEIYHPTLGGWFGLPRLSSTPEVKIIWHFFSFSFFFSGIGRSSKDDCRMTRLCKGIITYGWDDVSRDDGGMTLGRPQTPSEGPAKLSEERGMTWVMIMGWHLSIRHFF